MAEAQGSKPFVLYAEDSSSHGRLKIFLVMLRGGQKCDTFVTEKVTHKSANNRIGNWKGVPEKTWRTNIPIGGMMG